MRGIEEELLKRPFFCTHHIVTIELEGYCKRVEMVVNIKNM